MNRRLTKGWIGSEALTKDLKQPSGRIAGRAAMVVMRMSSQESRSRVLAGSAEFPPSLQLPVRVADNSESFFSSNPRIPISLVFLFLLWGESIGHYSHTLHRFIHSL
mgnify:CR=1 FL=1|jgi:hypothetical protein